jgi:uncharacterized protein YndB with AHSA1/START domain
MPRHDWAMPRTDKASRVIAAPTDRVYAALINPHALAEWLPPTGMSGRFERFDARPGGSYRMVLTYTGASTASGKATADSDIVEARFVDLVPGARAVQAVNFVADDQPSRVRSVDHTRQQPPFAASRGTGAAACSSSAVLLSVPPDDDEHDGHTPRT